MPQGNLVSDTIGTIASVAIMTAGGSVTVITWIREYFKGALDRCREQNAGKTAVEALKKDVDDLKQHQEARHDKDAVMNALIHRLEQDCQFLMRNLLSGNPPRKRGTQYIDDEEDDELKKG